MRRRRGKRSIQIPPEARRLIETAVAARKNAYCPYSRYAVGAAVLGGSGRIYPGCNVETPTLIAHICAERAAIFNAFTHGEREIRAVATVSKASEPCGACRQMILEFGIGDTPIYSLHHDPARGVHRLLKTSISKLMPRAHTGRTFGFENPLEPAAPARKRRRPRAKARRQRNDK